MNNFLLMNSSSAKSQFEKGLMESWLQTPQVPGQDPQGCLLSGTTLKIHLNQYHSQLEGKKLLCFPLKKGNVLKKQGITPWLEGLGVGIKLCLRSREYLNLILCSMRQIIIIIHEKTPEYPGIPGLLIPVGFAQGQEGEDGLAGTRRGCLLYQ